MIKRAATKRNIAVFFLGLMVLETLIPLKGLALTSGPAQPEMTQFQPAGMNDMVDLFTGDFKYNVPLLDVDGYPVNLSYAQGSGMEDEASWVGLGWSLNVGSVTRQLRGVPDDHNGDKVTTRYHMKKKVTTGAKVSGRLELTGWETLKVGGSVSAGLFYDNYTGYGAEVGYGYNAGLSLSSSNAGSLTVGLRSDISSSTAAGVSKTLGASLSIGSKMNDYVTNNIGANYSQSYNSREGMKSITLGASYGHSGVSGISSGITFDLNTPVFYPAGQIPFKNASHTFSVDLGVTAYTVSLGAGFTGYRTERTVAKSVVDNYAYGSLYGSDGKNNPHALMDFMREKDNIVVPDMQHIALPIATPDNFSYSSQTGGGQFKVYNNGTGVFFNNRKVDDSHNTSFGSDLGWGALFHGGVSFYDQQVQDVSQKWVRDNDFLSDGDFPSAKGITEEQTYLKNIGENTMENEAFASRIDEEEPVRVPVYGRSAGNRLQKTDYQSVPGGEYRKVGRQIRNNVIQYLTAAQAQKAYPNRNIPVYPILDTANFTPGGVCNEPVAGQSYVDVNRKAHHISEISVLGNDGKRLVYGVPVYNLMQKEISFAYKPEAGLKAKANQVQYKVEGGQIKHKHAGTDEYYNEQTQPAYATSYLLSGILSPDYVDLTGDGITDDDRGTAVKFNYSKMAHPFKWRSPVSADPRMATLNKANLADPDDDKASIVYGEKELWYLHSIETKTKIAYFITADRQDGLSVADLHGNFLPDANRRQRKLKEIRLYSKSDLVTPIKTVYFNYHYSLCQNVPNHVYPATNGKLGLASVHFTYGSSKLGEHHPYKFSYIAEDAGKGKYEELAADRWGTYKDGALNPGGLSNDDFPYTRNIKPGLFQLNRIELPTGGTIEIDYESDVYSYVQDRRAMEMQPWPEMVAGANDQPADFQNMTKLKFRNTAGATDLASFRELYLNGEKYLFGKVFVNLTDEPWSTDPAKFDWVPCYAEVTGVNFDGDDVTVSFAGTTVNGTIYNPFIAAAWQRMRLDYPRYAYPGFRNKIPDNQAISATLSALTNAISNLRELKEDFNERSVRKGFAKNIVAGRSFIRLAVAEKLGGGARVKQVSTREVWDNGPEEAAILQYTYTTEALNGNAVSSGVASYEPSLGGDENPWRLPDPYTQVNRKALNNEYYLEQPFGESLFPSPVVGYSHVKVESRSGREGTGVSQTGYIQHEFYTARDFPTEVAATGIDRSEKTRPAVASFFGSKSVYELIMSQGYVVRMNDMHGKPKAERVFNQQKKEISATEYYYHAEDRGGSQRLVNRVDVVDEKGAITKNQVISRELDLIVDMREGETSNSGTAINLGADVIPILWFFVPVPHFPITSNSDYRLFRSASAVKTVQYFGVLKKVVKKVDGSSISSSHLLYDKYTGMPVVTATDNEFKDPVYSLSLPAYWKYERMGHAYKSADMLLKGLAIDKDGLIDSRFSSFLTPGDEMFETGNGARYWVIEAESSSTSAPEVRIISRNGIIQKSLIGNFKIIRSGFRNQLGAVMGTITSLEKPFSDTRLNLPENGDLTGLIVLDAKATLYAEDWGQRPTCRSYACPDGWTMSADGLRCLQPPNVRTDVGFYNSTWQVTSFQTEYAKRAEFYDSDGFHQTRSNGFWAGKGGRLYPNAIWIRSGGHNQWNMLKKKFYAPSSGDYWIGFAGDDRLELRINNALIHSDKYNNNPSNWENWNMRRIYLSEGVNEIDFRIKNTEGDYVGAFEIYDNTRQELLDANPDDIDVIFNSHMVLEDGRPYEAFIMDSDANYITHSMLRCASTPGPVDYSSEGETFYCGTTTPGDCPAGYEKSADGLNCVKRVAFDTEFRAVYSGTPAPTPSMEYGGAKLTDESGGVIGFNDQSDYFGRRSIPAGYSSQNSRLMKVATWANASTQQVGDEVHLNFCIDLPDAGDYWFAHSSVAPMNIDVNSTGVYYEGDWSTSNPIYWQVHKMPVNQGRNHIRIRATVGNFMSNAFALEIYKGTDAQMANLAGSASPELLFSTNNIDHWGVPYNVSHHRGNTIIRQRYSCSPNVEFDMCASNLSICSSIPMREAVNPYMEGLLGNWLPSAEKVFLTDRKATPEETVDVVRKGGAYKRFTSFWQLDPATQKWKQSADLDWATVRWITAYDQYSQELENKNALGQYSATRFGFNGALPLILGTNAQSRELFADGFEDYHFIRKCSGYLPCLLDEFDIRKLVAGNLSTWLEPNDAHSGNYSLRMAGPVHLRMQAFTEKHGPGKYLVRNERGEYQRKPVAELQLFGFNPEPEKEYIFSAWMKDASPRSKSLPVSLKIDGVTIDGNWKATVEGWKLAEYHIDMSVFTATDMRYLDVELSGSAGTLIDDIRMYPKAGQAVTYAYDDRTLRLMAELDANNFATFYEYDEQGRLIRVKKETEKGILTIKESRSAYIKRSLHE